MKMRRLVLEVVVPDEDFPTDTDIIRAVDDGLMQATFGSRRDIPALRPGDVCDFTDREWAEMLEASRK
jgi:hypothetical protein